MKSGLKHSVYYILLVGGFLWLTYFIILKGLNLEVPQLQNDSLPSEASHWGQFTETIQHNLNEQLSILLLQIISIIGLARLLTYVCSKIGQPAVIGEIAAGILLGPSFLGYYFPEFSLALFPVSSLSNLKFLSQIGLILFMFVVGMELDLKFIRKQAFDALVISHASIVVPFTMGVGLGYFLYEKFAPADVKFTSFALFMGIAMSITAFPVLARIVQERNLHKTSLGAIVITCAAADDITAWCLLAMVIAIVKAGAFTSALYTILAALFYVLFMLLVVRPFLRRVGNKYYNTETISKPVVAFFVLVLLISSTISEVIGIHALFGAFLAGVVMPDNLRFRNIFIDKVEDLSVVLLLPLFFVFTGLRTEIGLLSDVNLWQACIAVIAVAVFGKFIGSAGSALYVGQSLRNSFIIGFLMNTRGLMELVVLNIGFDLGVLSPEIFTMMVMMALVTTFMTGPALNLIDRFMPERKAEEDISSEVVSEKYSILFAFGNTQRGRRMLRLASAFIRKSQKTGSITALHITPSNELNVYNQREFERQNFQPIQAEAEKLKIGFNKMFEAAPDVEREIIRVATSFQYNLVMVGIGQSVFDGTLMKTLFGLTKRFNPLRLFVKWFSAGKHDNLKSLDDQTRNIISQIPSPVGIFIDKDFQSAEHIVIPLFDAADAFLLVYASRLYENNQSQITILDSTRLLKSENDHAAGIGFIDVTRFKNIKIVHTSKPERKQIENTGLMLISLETYEKAVQNKEPWLSYSPSILVIRQGSY